MEIESFYFDRIKNLGTRVSEDGFRNKGEGYCVHFCSGNLKIKCIDLQADKD